MAGGALKVLILIVHGLPMPRWKTIGSYTDSGRRRSPRAWRTLMMSPETNKALNRRLVTL